MPKRFFRLILPLLTACLLFGCQAPGPQPSDEESHWLSQANAELALARSSLSPAKELHQLNAAKYFHQAGDRSAALSVLNTVNENILPLEALAEYSLLASTLALEDDSFFLAQRHLSTPQIERDWRKLPLATQQQWLKMRGDLCALLGQEQNSIENYALLSEITHSETDRQYAHERIWFLLSYLPQNSLEQFQATSVNPVLNGWYELALLSRQSHSDIRQLQQMLFDWRRKWPQHPANAALPQGLAVISQLSGTLPIKVALLLPAQGKLAKAGEAIQQGFLSAWYDLLERYGEAGEVLFFDSADNDDIVSLYQKAIAQGAEVVIGPLDKDKANQLAAMEELPVPTLALNYLDDTASPAPAKLFQFGLAVTDEAKQIADRAWLEGHRHVLAITPDSKWGAQALAAFRAEWEMQGGTLEITNPYQLNQNDFSPLLTGPLHLTQSTQRHQRLQELLGKRFLSVPRRRQDLDMVFLVAYPQHARQIKPTLDFLFAGDLAIYATSHIYNGQPHAGLNRDLDGIKFTAMPWVLPGTLSARFKPDDSIPTDYRQLFALGLDAFQLHQWLTQIEQLPGARLFGSTGALSLNRDRIIHREQPWGVFRNGRVIAAPVLAEETFAISE